MKKKLLIILCSCFYSFCSAQSLSHSVIGASGESFHSPNGSLDWTLGEIMTETYNHSDKIFTQGFQQPEIKTDDPGFTMVVYPNPVLDSLNVKIKNSGSYRLEVYNMLGQKIFDRNINLNLNEVPFQIDFHDFGPALYVLRIFNLNTGTISSFKIEKI